MKILYDHQIFSSQRFGGISRYHAELFREFDRSHEPEWELPLFFSNNAYLKELRPVRSFFPSRRFKGRDRILERINRIRGLHVLKYGKFDLFHPTFYHSYFLEHLGGKPFVLTVHDMIHDEYPGLPAATWEIHEKKKLTAAARRIIVPSRATADALIRFHGISASRIRVVMHGAPPSHPETQDKLPGQEFIFVGGRNYYKNFGVVLRALQLRPDFSLLCVGSPFSEQELQLQHETGVSRQLRQAMLNDGELIAAYASSAGLIFSSESEGFGLPVLESFAANCPVLLADTPVFHEVAGDAAIYFAPHSQEELAAGMDELVAARQVWAEAGRARVKFFSWDKCARETMSVYHEALQSGNRS